ncbi:hypothetical protein PV11_00790 [Exophiala sideris]|uniref:Uncharacterized protein n=1 Tax=Exophiala sideris TaxID=1016849 RepID=A0A0D1YUA9_9EURO|nr:hypothetical protein PV11_00790 [Exophiala sideris]
MSIFKERVQLSQQHILLVAFFALSAAFPTPFASPGIRQIAATASSDTCAHPGNSDFYGFGIRIGIYLQILTTMASMLYIPESLSDCENANAVLLLATFIALGKSVGNKELQVVDVVVLLRILWLIIVCGFSLPDFTDEVLDAMKNKRHHYVKSLTTKAAVIFRWVLFGFIAGYNAWFWFRGLDSFEVQRGCPTFAFFFSKLDVHGALRRIYNFTSIMLVVVYGILPVMLLGVGVFLMLCGLVIVSMFISLFIFILAAEAFCLLFVAGAGVIYFSAKLLRLESHPRWERTFEAWRKIVYLGKTREQWLEIARTQRRNLFTWWYNQRNTSGKPDGIALMLMADSADTSDRHTPETKPEKTQVPRWKKVYLAFLLMHYVFSITGIELTIFWNSVEDPYALGPTGQLIPFVIGILSATKVLGQVINEIEKKLYERTLEHYPDIAGPKASQATAMGQYQKVEQNEHDKQDEENKDTSNDAADLDRRSTIPEHITSHEVRISSEDDINSQPKDEPTVAVTNAENTSESASLLPHQGTE